MTVPTSQSPAGALKIKEMPTVDRPRERLRSLGAQALSTTELIATVLGSSVSASTDAMVWTNFASPTEFAFYEMRQTTGPFVTGLSMTARLGN